MSVPKRAFCYWGNPKMSWLRFMSIKSFRIMNPDWYITLYTTQCTVREKTWHEHNEQDFFLDTGIDYTDQLKDLDIKIVEWENPKFPNISASHNSNFLKWRKLSTHGGVYFDMDILWTKPISDYYESIKESDIGLTHNGRNILIGFMFSSPNNQFFSDVYNQAFNTYTPGRYQCAGVVSVYSMIYGDAFSWLAGHPNWDYVQGRDTLEDIRKKYPDQTVTNIVNDLVYARTYRELDKIFEKVHEIPNDPSLGIHWFGGNPVAQKWNKLLEAETYTQYDTTLTRALRKVLQ